MIFKSLLGNEDDLVKYNDPSIVREVFYKALIEMFPHHNLKQLKKTCFYDINDNGEESIRIHKPVYAAEATSSKSNWDNCIFKGFPTCSDIKLIYHIISESVDNKSAFDPSIHTISKINKYPMHIHNITGLFIQNIQFFDYCENVNIDDIDTVNMTIPDDNTVTQLNSTGFDFFKCVGHINTVSIRTNRRFVISKKPAELSVEIDPHVFKNINTEAFIISASCIDNSISHYALPSESDPIIDMDKLTKFVDVMYDQNNISEFYIDVESYKTIRYAVVRSYINGQKYQLVKYREV